MRFIRDIIDNQHRLPDDVAPSTDAGTSVLPKTLEFAEQPVEQANTLAGPTVADADASYVPEEALPIAESGFDNEPQGDFDADIGLLERTVTEAVQEPVSPPLQAEPPRQDEELFVRQSRTPIEPTADEPELQQRASIPVPPPIKRPETVLHRSEREMPLPLRERAAVREPNLEEQRVAPAQPEMRRSEPIREASEDHVVKVPAPAAGRGSNRGARAKTRLLGFHPAAAQPDPMSRLEKTESAQSTQFPVGWLVITSGPGRGTQFTIEAGVAQIGRADGQAIRLDFGDTSISRENHAAIAYDNEQNSFFIGHGGKANLVRRNGRPVLSTEELAAGDTIRVGETTLRFVPLCGPDFSWDQPQQTSRNHAVRG